MSVEFPFDVAEFLARDWQRSARFFKHGIANWSNRMSPDELAGLACDDGIESRIVTTRSSDGEPSWHLRRGPFSERDFAALGDEDWTLLVQDVDKFDPDVRALIQLFSFLPNWRIDDVMVSFAMPGGSVGPHWDDYDVFLIQGIGRREWSITRTDQRDCAVMPNSELRLIADFQPDQTWIAEPGDVLYLPPGIGHYGVALDECMTYSIGFRAPARRELGAHVVEALLQRAPERRFVDPGRTPQSDSFELTKPDMAALISMVREPLSCTDDAFLEPILAALTETKLGLEPEGPFLEDWRVVPPEQQVRADPALRVIRHVDAAGHTWLAAAGEVVQCRDEHASRLTRLLSAESISVSELFHGPPRLHRRSEVDASDDDFIHLMRSLLAQGYLYLESDDE